MTSGLEDPKPPATAPEKSKPARWWQLRKNRRWVNLGIAVLTLTAAAAMVLADSAGGFGLCLFFTACAAGPLMAVVVFSWMALDVGAGAPDLMDIPTPWFAALAVWLLFLLALILMA